MKKKNKTTGEANWGKKKIFWIDISPYNFQVMVVLNGQFEDAFKMIKKSL